MMEEPFDRIVQFTYFIYLHCIKYPSSIEQSVHAQGMNRDKCEIRSSISNAIQNSIVAELIFGLSDVRSIDLQNRLMIDVKRNLTMANVFTNAKENNVLRFLPSSYDVLVLHNFIQFSGVRMCIVHCASMEKFPEWAYVKPEALQILWHKPQNIQNRK